MKNVQPRVIVCLGATAAQALLGRGFLVTQQRGELIKDTGVAPFVMATVHPSSIVRIEDDTERAFELRRLAEDLRGINEVLN